MLTFTLVGDYDRETRHVYIDPAAVVAVKEYESRAAYGGYRAASEILLANGHKYDVYEHVAKKIREAKNG